MREKKQKTLLYSTKRYVMYMPQQYSFAQM